jgi:hypothetical protein
MTQHELEALLTGERVRLWPYAPALFPRDTLYQVWQLLEAEQAWERLFWWQDVPEPQRGDLLSFATYMRDKIPLLVQRRQDGALCGLIYFDEAIAGLRANISIWFAKAAWGAAAIEAGEIATRYGHQCLGFPALWGVTPWKAAARFAQKCGYRHVMTLERYVRIHHKPMPMHYTVHEG